MNILGFAHWLLGLLFTPNGFQGVMTFCAAIYAGHIAMSVARDIYPGQKDKDRQVSLSTEMAEAVRIYFHNLEFLINSSAFSGLDHAKLVLEAKSALNKASLLVSPDTAALLWQLHIAALRVSAMTPSRAVNEDQRQEVAKALSELTPLFTAALNAARAEMRLLPMKHSMSVLAIFGAEK